MSEPTPPSEEENKNLVQIEQELKEVDPDILKGLPKDKKDKLVRSISIIRSHSGPLPSPDTLAAYSEIIPNGADRIMKLTENQSAHRIDIEKKVIGSQVIQSYMGQIFAFILCLCAIGGAIYCISLGFQWGGGFIGGAGLIGLAAVFIKGKSYQSQNLAEKNPTPAETKKGTSKKK